MASTHDIQLKIVLLNFIRSQCRGRQQGKSHHYLSGLLAVPVRRIRRLVNELVVEGHLLGATPATGVFLIVDDEDYKAAAGDLADHAYPILKRMRALEAAWHQSHPPKQGELPGIRWEGAAHDSLGRLLPHPTTPPITVSVSHA